MMENAGAEGMAPIAADQGTPPLPAGPARGPLRAVGDRGELAVEGRLLTRWLVSFIAGADLRNGQSGYFRDLRCLMPSKTAKSESKAAEWILRRMGRDVLVDEVVRSMLDLLEVKLLEFFGGAELFEDLAVRAEQLTVMRCVALHHDAAERFDATVAGFPEEDRLAYTAVHQRAVDWARDWEYRERERLREAHANVTGLTHARQEAARQKERADRAAAAAGAKVSDIAREQRRLQEALSLAESEIDRLRALVAELEEQTGRIISDYERRLARQSRGEDPSLPLTGKTVLVVADPNRAGAYRAEASALGATEVDFIDGMQHPGARLRALASGADLVVLCTAWCKHAVSAQVRQIAGDRLVEVYVAGVRSFRDAMDSLAVNGHSGTSTLGR